ncbi:endophilin-A-like isoform X1 [Limulus polyphemus]|uniref:Endophilin-A n=1 Tax=Limulus polyphemus TaxID=6850 RepID=A0ABM1TKI3_LIMPO|nr:endophilin-A-like isoform X1 [Limulus polyphemus]
MAFAGLRKQINKANQYMSEKIGGAEGTKFTEEYMEMERKVDLLNELVEELITKTKEFLQPNPASRAKMVVSSKLRGGTKTHAYPQPEGILGDEMVKYGMNFGEENIFAQSLIETGETLRQMAEVRFALEDSVKQNFLEPLHHLQTKDLKDVLHHRKKLQGRRLDYDCKKRRQAKGSMPKAKQGTAVTEEEIRLAEDKFEESFNLASMGMHNLLENDVEQISQLASLAESLYEYHCQCAEIMRELNERLIEHKNLAMGRPHEPYQPRKLEELNIPAIQDDLSPGDITMNYNGGPPPYPMVSASPARSPASSPINPRHPDTLFLTGHGSPSTGGATSPCRSPSRSPNASPLPSPVRSPARTPVRQQPCCQALYDFDPENEGELGFKEGDVINLVCRIDENWYEGTMNGRSGLFPVSYVQVMVPLP